MGHVGMWTKCDLNFTSCNCNLFVTTVGTVEMFAVKLARELKIACLVRGNIVCRWYCHTYLLSQTEFF